MSDTNLLISSPPSRFPFPKFYLASFAAWVGAVALGSVIGYSSPAIASLNEAGSSLPISDEDASWLGSVMCFGGIFGSFISGKLIDLIGRKGTLVFTTLPLLVGWLFISYAERTGIYLLLCGRFLTGLCCALLTTGAIVYISETASYKKRGFLGSGFQFAVTVGIELTYIVGKYLPWSWLAIQCCIYPILLMILLGCMPESPSWLIGKGRISEATEAQLFLHGEYRILNAQDDISPLYTPNSYDDSLQNSINSVRTAIRQLRKPNVWKPLGLSLTLMFFQQFSGITAIIFYASSVFESTGSKEVSPADATIIVGAFQVVFTLIACFLTDVAGRRVLLITSGAGNAFSLLLMAVYHFVKTAKGDQFVHHGFIAVVPVIAVVLFVSFFSLGYGPLPWLLMGELLPSKMKGLASAISLSFNSLCMFVITKCFANIVSLIHEEWTYLAFSIICVLSCIFVAICLPETKGKSLEEIEQHFRGDTSSEDPF